MPPSTTISAPVMKRASSEARKSTALAVSRPSPANPSGMRLTRLLSSASTSPPARCFARRVSTMGVCSWPGTTLFTRMFLGAYCTATTRESWITPALVAAYATCAEPLQRMPDAEAMLTIAPPPCFSITGSTYLQPRNTLFRLKFTCASNTSSDISTGPPAAEPPTLFTRMSMRPKRFMHVSTMARTSVPFVTSQTCVAMPGAFASVSSMLFASRSTAKTCAPSSTKRTVVERPLPQPGPTEPAPAMIATLPLSREPIETPRIVDEHRLALGFGGCSLRERVDEIAVVRHFVEVRMRPVGAPHGAIAELGDELALEGARVGPRGLLSRYPLGTAHLDPHVLVLQ